MHSQKNQIHFTIFVFWPGDLMSISVSFDINYKHTCIHKTRLEFPEGNKVYKSKSNYNQIVKVHN